MHLSVSVKEVCVGVSCSPVILSEKGVWECPVHLSVTENMLCGRVLSNCKSIAKDVFVGVSFASLHLSLSVKEVFVGVSSPISMNKNARRI